MTENDPANLSDDYETAREAAYHRALGGGDYHSMQLVDLLLEEPRPRRETPMIDGTSGEPSSVNDFDAFRENLFWPKGLSKDGQRRLNEAARNFSAYRLATMNKQARAFEAFCETGETRPGVIAEQLAKQEDAALQRNIKYYNEVLDSLSDADAAAIRTHNLKIFGIEAPISKHPATAIEPQLAAAYPEEYLEEFQKSSKNALNQKGATYHRYRRVSTGPSNIAISVSPSEDSKGDFDSGEVARQLQENQQKATGYTSYEYYATEPELPDDELLE